jgi:MYXO-CTERM domain-containing protein
VACDLDCSTTVKNTCDTRCQDDKGAIFCDGQFLDADDPQACVDYLSTVGISVNVDAWDSADGGGNGGTSCSASTGLPGAGAATNAALAGLVLIALVGLRRRSRQAVLPHHND